jgi:hypothetical protein
MFSRGAELQQQWCRAGTEVLSRCRGSAEVIVPVIVVKGAGTRYRTGAKVQRCRGGAEMVQSCRVAELQRWCRGADMEVQTR